MLIKNVIYRKKHYVLHFVAENDVPIKRWYYDFKHWGFDRDNLEMVSGANALCESYAKGKNEVTIDVLAGKKPLSGLKGYDEYIAQDIIIDGMTHQASFINSQFDKILYGRTYQKGYTQMWICPVTLFVLGRYPKYLYIKAND